MTLERWLAAAVADAQHRDLAALVPLLEGLATSLGALRRADFADDASGKPDASPSPRV